MYYRFLKYKNSKFIITVIFIFFFSLLLPYISTGYYGDDILDSQVRGEIINRETNFWSWIIYTGSFWLNRGRIFIGGFIAKYGLFYLVGSRLGYKIFLLLITTVSVVTIGTMCSFYLQLNSIKTYLIMICLFLFYTTGANNIAMYAGYMQFLTIFFSLSLLFVDKYHIAPKPIYIFISTALIICLIIFSEVGFILSAVIILHSLQYENTRKKCVGLMLFTYGIMVIFYLCINLLYKNQEYDGTTICFDGGAIVKTFSMQFLSAVPCGSVLMKYDLFRKLSIALTFTLMLLVLASYLYMKNRYLKSAFLTLEGMAIWIGTSLVVSITEKYQNQMMSTSQPHIYTYVEWMGFMMVVFGLIKYYSEKRRNIYKHIMVLTIVIGLLNIITCEHYIFQMVKEGRYIYIDMPDLYISAIESGLFDAVGQNDLIIIDNSLSPTLYESFLANHRNVKTEAIRLDQFLLNYDQEQIKSTNIYITKCFVSDKQKICYLDLIDSFEIWDGGYDITIRELNCFCDTENEISILPKSNGTIIRLEDCISKRIDDNYLINYESNEPIGYAEYNFWG